MCIIYVPFFFLFFFFFFQAEDGIRDDLVTGVQTCALPILTDKNSGVGPFFRVAGGEIPPEDRLNTENLEEVGGDARDRRARRLRGTGNGYDVIIVFRNRLEAAVLIAKVVEVWVRKMCPPAFRADLED